MVSQPDMLEFTLSYQITLTHFSVQLTTVNETATVRNRNISLELQRATTLHNYNNIINKWMNEWMYLIITFIKTSMIRWIIPSGILLTMQAVLWVYNAIIIRCFKRTIYVLYRHIRRHLLCYEKKHNKSEIPQNHFNEKRKFHFVSSNNVLCEWYIKV